MPGAAGAPGAPGAAGTPGAPGIPGMSGVAVAPHDGHLLAEGSTLAPHLGQSTGPDVMEAGLKTHRLSFRL